MGSHFTGSELEANQLIGAFLEGLYKLGVRSFTMDARSGFLEITTRSGSGEVISKVRIVDAAGRLQ